MFTAVFDLSIFFFLALIYDAPHCLFTELVLYWGTCIFYGNSYLIIPTEDYLSEAFSHPIIASWEGGKYSGSIYLEPYLFLEFDHAGLSLKSISLTLEDAHVPSIYCVLRLFTLTIFFKSSMHDLRDISVYFTQALIQLMLFFDQ